jgi:hypothetical protein
MANWRPIVSVAPPGGYGTINLMGADGNGSAAIDCPSVAAEVATASTRRTSLRRTPERLAFNLDGGMRKVFMASFVAEKLIHALLLFGHPSCKMQLLSIKNADC